MTEHYRPYALPKIRSEAIRKSATFIPCTLRISSFIPGHKCAEDGTRVFCHLTGLGKGMSTKVTDIAGAVGCLHCHQIVDRVDSRIRWIEEHYPAALADRYMRGMVETWTLLITAGVIVIPDGEVIR